MNVFDAAKDTVALIAEGRKMIRGPICEASSLRHMESMVARMSPEMSEGKRNRWLGYIQGVAVANGWLTLDDCKAINMRNAGEPMPVVDGGRKE